MTNEHVPQSACQFLATEFSISDVNGEDARTAPFRMVARSGRPIDHPAWGRVVHDMAGYFVGDRGRIPIDYCHSNEVIGYGNRFELNESGDLVISGALVPGRMKEDRTADVIAKAAAGVPWEASINFGGTGIEVERVPEGSSTEVNGYTFEGPGTVVRRWPLRGVAVVPYGADQFTSTEFNQGQTVLVNVKEDVEMAKSLTELEQAIEEQATSGSNPVGDEVPAEGTVETPEAGSDTEESPAEEQQESAAAEGGDVESELSLRRKEGLRFKTQFGDTFGAQYFADGLTFEQATQQHIVNLSKENEQLKQRLDAATTLAGEEQPLSASSLKAKTKKKPAVKDPF